MNELEETLRERLAKSNEFLRTFYQVVLRKGVTTYWEGLEERLKKELDLQHKIMYPNSPIYDKIRFQFRKEDGTKYGKIECVEMTEKELKDIYPDLYAQLFENT
jgi:hypothetical protein